MLSEAVRKTFLGLIEANKATRAPAGLSHLCVGLKCGGSDGFSGISANPAIGHTADLLAALGGRTILSEFPELCGVEQNLINRSTHKEISRRFAELMRAYEARARSVGSGFEMNPSPGNIRDGLITDAMKSAGAAKKGGTSPVTAVLDYTEPSTVPGLNLQCTPGNDVECVTAQVGAGANVVLFTTGLGTPTGNPIAPVVKLSTNSALAQRMSDIIDIDTGGIVSGEATIEQMGETILEYVIQVASGEAHTEGRTERSGRFHSLEERRLALNDPDTGSRSFRLDGKIAVVTGGGSGIGRAIALRFAAHGATLRVLDMNDKDADETCQQITAAGGRASAHRCDVTSQDEVKSIFGELFRSEHLHILVNNAGVSHVGSLETTTEADFDRIFRVNVKGYYNCMLASVVCMRANGGVILNMASIAGSAGISDRFAYSMSKGAVIAMTYSVAKDYLAHNIRCNCISPARVHTPFVDGYLKNNYRGREQEMFEKLSKSQPIGRMAEPEEVASLALFLCSDEASFITGVDYPLDGGFCNLRG